jgi:hypothetical protein
MLVVVVVVAVVFLIASWHVLCGTGIPSALSFVSTKPASLLHPSIPPAFFWGVVYCCASVPGREANIVRIAHEQAPLNHRIYYSREYVRFPGESYDHGALSALSGVTLVETRDAGPLTKVLGPLQDEALSPDTILIVGDDDSFHQVSDLATLARGAAGSLGVHQAMSWAIHGSRGYAFRKDAFNAPELHAFWQAASSPTFDARLRMFSTESCFKTDDTLLTGFCQRYGIPIYYTPVSYPRVFLNQTGSLASPARVAEHEGCVASLLAERGVVVDDAHIIM